MTIATVIIAHCLMGVVSDNECTKSNHCPLRQASRELLEGDFHYFTIWLRDG